VNDLDKDTGQIQVEEVKAIIRKLQNGKAPGTDALFVHYL